MAAPKRTNKKIPVKQKNGGSLMLADSAFTRFIANNADAAQNYAGAMRAISAMSALEWRGDVAVPPGSPPADILEAFRTHTDLPLDLPWHSFLFYLSTYLMSEGVAVEVEGQNITPEIWSVILAPSGAGKSYSLARIKNGAPVGASITGIASGAKLIETMRDNEEAGIVNAMLVDEFGQMLKSLENEGSPLFDAKQYFLLAYDGDKIERNTKRESIVVQNSKISFLGLNVEDTFFSILSMESLKDGMAQRFAYCIAERDPARPFYNFPRYNTAALDAAAAQAWARILAVPLHGRYTYSPEALAAYDQEFTQVGQIIENGKQINVSFFRRLTQRTHKLALLMHIILGDGSATISKTAMVYAMRQTRLHIGDAAKLIAMKSPKVNEMMVAVDELAQKLAATGEKLTARRVRQSVWAAHDDQELAEMLLAAYKNMQGNREEDAPKPRRARAKPAADIAEPARAEVVMPPAMDINNLIRDHRDEHGAAVYTG